MTDHSSKPKHHRLRWIIFIILLVIIAAWGIISRIAQAHALHKETTDAATPIVNVMQAPHEAPTEDVTLPGTVQAWHEAPIYARTNGYIKDWRTDIGAQVKAGDLLAEIEAPEIDAQTHQAEADLVTAQANDNLAQSTAKRWEELLKTNSVSKQEANEKISAAAASAALVSASKANLDRLKQTEDFQRVVAPFDGIITARNIDTGSLINAGSDGTEPQLFHIAETDKLRIYVQVPEYDASYIKPDMTAELKFAEQPQTSYTATFLHSADAIDPVARTLLVQFEIDNAQNVLLPGSYAEVHLKIPTNPDAVHLPVNTLLFRSAGTQVATVDADNKVLLKTITIGRDYGKEVEVTSGITADDKIIINPLDSMETGQVVKISDKSTDKKEAGKKNDKKDAEKQDTDKGDTKP